jgi:hypothetical protein
MGVVERERGRGRAATIRQCGSRLYFRLGRELEPVIDRGRGRVMAGGSAIEICIAKQRERDWGEP